jgi:hypothetical protein
MADEIVEMDSSTLKNDDEEDEEMAAPVRFCSMYKK